MTYLSSFVHKTLEFGMWSGDRGTYLLGGGAPFYDTYETSDGEFVAVGALEPQFYKQLLEGTVSHSDNIHTFIKFILSFLSGAALLLFVPKVWLKRHWWVFFT